MTPHRLLPALLALFSLLPLAQAQQEETPEEEKALTIFSDVLIDPSKFTLSPAVDLRIDPTRSAEPTVPVQVVGITPAGVDPAHIVQRSADVTLGPDWYQSGIEPQVIQAKLDLHGLPSSDYSRVLRWERDALRAAVWLRLVQIIQKPAAQRTAVEQSICDHFASALRDARIGCVQASIAEYGKWKNDPYSYEAPAPFEWNAPARSISQYLTFPKPPSFEEFQAYGPAIYYEEFNNDATLVRIAEVVAKRIQNTATVALVPSVAAAGTGAAIGATLGTTVLKRVVTAVIPYAFKEFHRLSPAVTKAAAKIAAVTATKVVGKTSAFAAKGVLQSVSAFAGPFAALVDVIVTTTFEAIALNDANQLPVKLQEALVRAQTEPLDLTTLSANDAVLGELYAVFLKSTLPDYPATEQAPAAIATDRQWLVTLPYQSFFNPSRVIQCLDWDGNEQSVRLQDNWFVVRDSSGNERMSLEFECQNLMKEAVTISIRNGTSFFVSNHGEETTASQEASSFTFLDWDGIPRTAKVGLPANGTALSPAALTTTAAIGKSFSQSFTITHPGPGTYTYQVVPVVTNYSYVGPVSPLPPGMSLSSAGVLSGTPTRAGRYEFQIAATNSPSNSHPVAASYVLHVTSRPAPVPAGNTVSYRMQGDTLATLGSNHGTWQGPRSPAFSTGIVGQAALLDIGDSIALPANIFSLTQRSFEVWFKTGQPGAILGQFSTSTPSALPALYIGTDGKLRATFFYNNTRTVVTSANVVNDNLWHHAVLTHDGSVERIYLDGVEIGSRTYANVNYDGGSYNYQLGYAWTDGWPGVGGAPFMNFDGLLDEVAIYNTVLTPAQIQNIYSAGGAGKALLEVLALKDNTPNGPYAHSVGEPYDAEIESRFRGTNVTASSTASVVGGTLPFGLSYNGMRLVGIPRSAGVFTFTTAVTGPDGLMGEREDTITITGPRQSTPEGLSLWWAGENNTQSIPGNTRPLTGTAAYATGLRGQAFSFSNNLLGIGTALPLNHQQAASFETWFRTTQPGNLLVRSSAVHNGPVLSVGSDGLLYSDLLWNPGRSPLRTPFRVDDGGWHHVAITHGMGEERLYVDGNLIALRTGLTSPSGQTGLPTYQLGGFTGLLDEPAIYTRAISADEITNLFTSGSNGKSMLRIEPLQLLTGFAGQPYEQALSVTSLGANPGTLTWSIEFGTLPPGITLSSTGLLSGTPVRGGSWPVTLSASGNGLSGARNYLLTIIGKPAELPNNAIAWWRAESDALDSEGNLDATISGNVSFETGTTGTGFRFDGSGGRVVLPSNSFPSPATDPTAPFTFETWFQTSLPGVILGRQEVDFPSLPTHYVPAVYVGQNGRLHVQMFWNGSINPQISSARVDDGRPHHLAVTFSSGILRVYLDGSLIDARSFTQVHHSTSLGYRYQLGTGYTLNWPQGNGSWLHFSGIIDETATYSRALSAAEVADIFNAGNVGKSSDATFAPVILPSGRVPDEYRALLEGDAGWTRLISGTLPPGITLNARGFLTGTAEVAGVYDFTVASQGSNNQWTLENYQIRIDGIPAPRLRDAGWFSGEGNFSGFIGTETLNATSPNVGFTSDGVVGQAFNLSGISDFLRIPNVPFPAPGGAWSFETWFRTTRSGAILGQTGTSGFVPMLYVDSAGLLRGQPYWSGSNSTLVSTTRVDDGVWHHAAITYSNGLRKLFLDGEEVASSQAPGQTYSTTHTFDIGNSTFSGWPSPPPVAAFLGQIDEPQVYDFALSAENVRMIRAAGGLGKSKGTLTDTLPDTVAGIGLPYNGSIAMAGQSGSFTYQLASGRLPAGLTLQSNGSLIGTARATGAFDFTVVSTSASGVKNSRVYQIVAASDVRFRPAGLQRWWQAQNNGANWSTPSATISHSGSYTSGITGQAFSYSSAQTQISTLPAGSIPNPGSNSPFTIDLWFRALSSGGILGQRSALGGNGEPNSGYVPMIYAGIDGRLRVQSVWTGTVQPIESTEIVVDGSWHHVAATFDGSAMRVYLNGSLIGTRSGISSVSYAPSYTLELGRVFVNGWNFGGTGWVYFDGQIDEVSTWNRALSDQEIARIAACGTAGKATARFTGTLPAGVRGRPYAQDLGMDGQPLPFSSLVSGTLPPGLNYGGFITGGGGVVIGTQRHGIHGTPTAAGSYQVRLSAQDFAANPGVSNSHVQRIEEDFTLTIDALSPNAAYDLWAGAAGLTGPAALPDAIGSGGMANLLKFAFNLDPNATQPTTLAPNGNSGLPRIERITTPGGPILRLTYLRRKNSGLTYTPQSSSTLNSFTAITAPPTVTGIDADWERVVQEIPATATRLFGRVEVQP